MNSNQNNQTKEEIRLFLVTMSLILIVNERVFVITYFYYVFSKK